MRNRLRPSLRDRYVSLLNEFDLASMSGRATITDLQTRLEAFRHHPVHFIPVAIQPGSPTGMWIATAGADYIFHVSPTQTSEVHAFHCALHEAGHILLGHSGYQNLSQYVRDLCSSLSTDPTAPIMLRTDYDDDLEQEAEIFATVGSGLIGRVSEATTTRIGIGDRRLYSRLSDAFADGAYALAGGQ